MMIQKSGTKIRSGREHREQGMVLVVATMVVVVIMLLSLPLLTKLSAQYGTTGKDAKTISALCLAEAGVEKAVLELNAGAWVKTEALTTDLTMAMDNFETPGGAIVGDVDITVRPYNNVDKTRILDATASVRHKGPSAVAKSVRVLLLKRDGANTSADGSYVIASWQEPPASL